MKHSLLAVFLMLSYAEHSFGQASPNEMQGTNHFTSYQYDKIDTVSMINGNVMLHIPLYSLAQRGKNPMTFSIAGNNLMWNLLTDCGNPDLCLYQYGVGDNICATEIGIQYDQDLNVCRTSTAWQDYSGNTISSYNIVNTFAVSVGGVTSHALAQDGANLNNFRSTDGSLFLLKGTPALYADTNATSILNGPVDVYDGSGSHTQFSDFTLTPYTSVFLGGTISSMNFKLSSMTDDPNGNQILRGILGPEPNRFYFKDTLGRLFPDAPREIQLGLGIWQSRSLNTLQGCPQSGKAFQPAAFAYEWHVPGSEGQTITYKFCYANVYIRTNFFGGGAGATTSYGSAGAGTSTYVEFDSGPYQYRLQSVILPDGTSWQLEYDSADPNSSTSEAYGDLTKVITPQGGSISYTYTTGPLCAGRSTLPRASRILTSRTVDDGLGHLSRWDYQIGVTSTNQTGTLTTVTMPLQPGDTVRNQTEHEYDSLLSAYDCPVVEKETRTYQGSVAPNHLLSKTSMTYQSVNDPNPVFSQQASSIVTTSHTETVGSMTATTNYSGYDSGFTAVRTTCSKTNYQVNAPYQCYQGSNTGWYGNTGTAQIRFALPKDLITHDYDGSVLREETTTYRWEGGAATGGQAYYDANILILPSYKTIVGPGGKTTALNYDENNGSPQGPRGNLTSSSVNVDGSIVGTSTIYDAVTGMPTSMTDARGISTSLEYDQTGAFVSKSTTSGLSTSYTFDPVLGSVMTKTDTNGVMFRYTHNDPLGRLTKIESAVGTSAENWAIISYPSPTIVKVSQDKDSKGDGLIVKTSISDGLNRVIQKISKPSTNETIYAQKSYDGLGRVYQSWNPSRCNPAVATGCPNEPTWGMTSVQYDAEGRAVTVTNPDSSHRYTSYTNNNVTSMDEIGNTWMKTNDALGRIIRVVEPGSLTTTYKYDVQNNLLCVDQWGAQSVGSPCSSPKLRSFTYDSLSRLITSSNQETGKVCNGLWSGGAVGVGSCQHGYDPNGNLVAKTDARGLTTTYSYDSLNRLIQTKYPLLNSSGVLAGQYRSRCYQYDTISGAPSNSNVIGRLVAEWIQTGNTCAASYSPAVGALTAKVILQYDPLGRPQISQQCIKGMCQASPFTQNQKYDLAGNMTFWTDGRGIMTFSQSFDSADRLINLTSSVSGNSSPSTLFSAQGYTPDGLPQSWAVGSYLNFLRNYDNRLRVISETVTH